MRKYKPGRAMPYQAEYDAGAHATATDACPYSTLTIGQRCAWLAGRNDAAAGYAHERNEGATQ